MVGFVPKMNHTFSEVSVEVQGVIIFVNWLLCMGTIGVVAYYVLIAKSLPDFKSCTQKKKKKKKKDPFGADLSLSSEEETPEEMEAEIDELRHQVRADMELQQNLKDDLGME